MSDNETMTKEEFLEGIQDAAQDLADPEGEFNSMVDGFRVGAEQARPFDPVMTEKVLAIVAAFEDFGAYVKSRAELLTAKTEG